MSRARRNSKRQEEEEEEEDHHMDSSSGDEDDEEAFVPSDEEDEEEEQQARPAPTPRRRSAPARASSSAAAAAASKSSRPTRAQSSAATAAASSAAAAAAAPAPAPAPAPRRSAQAKKPAAASSGSKRKQKPASSEDDESESESEDDDDTSERDSSSSDDEDAAQCSALKQKRGRKQKKARNSNSKDECSEAAAAAAGGTGAGCGDFGGEKKKDKKQRVPRSNQKKGGGGGGRSRHHDEDVPEDDPRRHGRTGGETLLEHFHRLRALYEPPEGAFAEMIAAQEEQEKRESAVAAPKKRSSSSSAAAAAASSSSSAAAAAAAPSAPELVFSDFVPRLPQSISCLVFTMLSLVTVARCERVNRSWRDTIQAKQGAAVYKRLFDSFFPLLRRFKDDQLRRQESDVDLKLLRKDSSSFFEQENKEGLTLWAARRTDGRAVPVFNPHANDPLGTLPVKEKTIDELLRPTEGAFHWKHTFINRMSASCVECRALCLDVYKLTGSRVCIDCAMRHPTGRYDVVNSGTAKGKFLLSDRELSLLPNVTEFDPVDDHKTIFFMSGMVRALRDRKYGGPEGFAIVWRERVAQAQARLNAKKAAGLSSKKLIPIVYRDNVGSTPEKTKGFFMCGRHNLATLFAKNPPGRPYPEASLE